MHIIVKLYATLGDYLPGSARDHAITLDIEPDTRLSEVIEQLHLPQRLVHLVLVNGIYVEPGARTETPLSEGDAVALWPPIAGG